MNILFKNKLKFKPKLPQIGDRFYWGPQPSHLHSASRDSYIVTEIDHVNKYIAVLNELTNSNTGITFSSYFKLGIRDNKYHKINN